LLLADAEDEGDGPACGVAMSHGGTEDAVRFLTRERFDLVFVGHGRVDEPCHVVADLVTSEAIALPGQGCCDDPSNPPRTGGGLCREQTR
jgi:hypothetical protein